MTSSKTFVKEALNSTNHVAWRRQVELEIMRDKGVARHIKSGAKRTRILQLEAGPLNTKALVDEYERLDGENDAAVAILRGNMGPKDSHEKPLRVGGTALKLCS